ncbi:MAG TPA: 4-diphosphocytidyl-2C-methyl-D-erythritol kinase, partial [Gammaproteobacteria bacterium]
MIFAEFALDDADGVILAHTHHVADGPLKKGRTLGAAEIAALRATGLQRVYGARLEPGDLDEDTVAERVAALLAGPWLRLEPPSAGRCNVVATRGGLLQLDPDRLAALNLADDAVTVATLAPLARAESGQVVATVKVIPFALAEARLAALLDAAGPGALLALHPFRPRRVALLLTELPGTRGNVLDKAQRVTAERLAALGCELASVARCAHAADAVASGLRAALAAHCDLLLVSGASVTTDRA